MLLLNYGADTDIKTNVCSMLAVTMMSFVICVCVVMFREATMP